MIKCGRLTEFVLKHTEGLSKNPTQEQIDKAIADFRFWYQLETYEPIGFGLPLSVNTGNFKMMLCRFGTEEPDKIYMLGKGEYDFKAHIIPVDENFRSSGRTTYADDILSEFERGYALPYEEGDHLVENIRRRRYFPNSSLYEEFAGDILFNKDNEIRWNSFLEDSE